MLEARVLESSKQNSIVSCGGKMFNKVEWIRVPDNREPEAERNPFLETRKLETSKPSEILENEGPDGPFIILDIEGEEVAFDAAGLVKAYKMPALKDLAAHVEADIEGMRKKTDVAGAIIEAAHDLPIP